MDLLRQVAGRLQGHAKFLTNPVISDSMRTARGLQPEERPETARLFGFATRQFGKVISPSSVSHN